MSYEEFLIIYHLEDNRGARSYYKEYKRKLIKEDIKYTILAIGIISICIFIGIAVAIFMTGGFIK